MERNEQKKDLPKKTGEKANKEVDNGPQKSKHKNQYSSDTDKKNNR